MKKSDGFIEWRGGKTWFHVAGDIQSGVTPLIVINGGPGCASDYCKPFDQLGGEWPVIRYDQIETGHSDRPNNPELWTFESYIEELETLIAHVGVKNFHLLGHSWGSMLALEFLKTERPQVKSLVLAASMWDIPLYQREVDQLLSKISPIAVTRARQLGKNKPNQPP